MRAKGSSLNKVLFVFAATFPLLLYAGTGWTEGHKIFMKGWLFHPDELTINEGDTVRWVNDDDTAHDLVFEDELPGFPKKEDPYIIRIGKEYSLTFEKAGEYKYYCRRHRDFDMMGKITVKVPEEKDGNNKG